MTIRKSFTNSCSAWTVRARKLFSAAVALSIVLACTPIVFGTQKAQAVTPPPPQDFFSFTLPAEYNASYQDAYGTVQYAVNATEGVAPQYFDITQNSEYDATTHTYSINSTIGGKPVQNVTIKVAWDADEWKVSLGDQAPPLQNGQPCFLGGPAAYTVHYDAPAFSLTLPAKYDASFQSTYGTVEYSTNEGSSYAALGVNMTETALPPDMQGNEGYKYSFETQPGNIMLKITWDEDTWMVQLSPSANQPTSGVGMAVALTDYFLQFDEPFYTVVWSYDASAFGPESLVTNGTVAIKPGDGIQGQADDLGGYYIIKPGTQVTVTLKPNYGYQFLKGSLNGNAVAAGAEVSTFTFTMPKAQLHLAALFDSAEDVVNTTSQSVTSGSISGGAGVIDSGNLRLDVTDIEISSEENAAMRSVLAAAGLTPITQLNLGLNLYQVVNQGVKTAAWETPQTELAAPVTVSMQLASSLQDAAAAYNVVRVHDGEYSVLPAALDATTGTVSFETDQFSDYALVISEGKALAKTGDDTAGLLPIAFGMLVAGIAVIAIASRERKALSK